MNTERAAFIIVLCILALYAAVILSAVSTCIVYARSIVEGKFKCDPDNRLTDMLGQMGTLSGLAAGYLLRSK